MARVFDAAMRFVVEPGAFRIMVGASSDDIRVETAGTVHGAVRELRTAELVATTVALG